MIIPIKITTLSPLHLGSGKGDVVIDADVVHDDLGLPYLPAKRLKGALYESALEVMEMSQLSDANFFSREALEDLFNKREGSQTQLIVHDFHLADYEEISTEWKYLQSAYGDIISSEDVLSVYSHLRYQTSIEQNGTAKDGSLRNMRVVDAGIVFVGEIEIINVTEEEKNVISLALQNLNAIGGKRNRGFGKIKCEITEPELQKQYINILAGGRA